MGVGQRGGAVTELGDGDGVGMGGGWEGQGDEPGTGCGEQSWYGEGVHRGEEVERTDMGQGAPSPPPNPPL